MALTSTAVKVIHTGDGSNTTFSYNPVVIFDNEDLEVTLTDNADNNTIISEGTGANDYSVNQVTYPGTGTLTYPASGATRLQSDERLTIKRVQDLTQETVLENRGGYLPKVQEDQYDRFIMVDQQQQEVLDRATAFPIEEDALDATLPPLADRALKQATWDADGKWAAFDADASSSTITPTNRTSARTLALQATLAGNVFDVLDPDFGAVFDGVTDTGAEINLATAAANSAGGGVVLLPAGTGIIETTVITYSNVYLMGNGMHITTLQAKDSLNSAVVQTEDYATLVGQNKWKTVDGVPYNMGFFDFTIDGNKANQTSGNGIEIYGKMLHGDRVMVRNCKDIGWVSEAGDVGGQDDYTDVPEGSLGSLWAYNCDSHGMRIRGPHDQRIYSIVSAGNVGWGLRIEYSATLYAGSCDINFTHIYSNTAGGIYASDDFGCDHVVVENNFGEGLSCNQWGIHIGHLEAFENCKTTGSFQVVFNTTSQRCSINSGVVRAPGTTAVGGILIAGTKNKFSNMEIRGDGGGTSTGTGIQINGSADYTQIVNTHIRDFDDTGGIGLDHNNGGASIGTTIASLFIENCDTIWENNSGSNYTSIDAVLDAQSGQTIFNGTATAAATTDQWRIRGTDSTGTNVLSRHTIEPGGNVNLNSTGVQSFTVTHRVGLIATPRAKDCGVTFHYTGSNTTFRVSAPWISSITSTQVTVNIAVITAAGAAETGKLEVEMSL